MTALFTLPTQIPVDSSGTPYGGAKLHFYRAGTTTYQDVYTTSALSVAHDRPVVADADGVFPAIYLNHAADYDYRVMMYTSADVLLHDQDNYPRNGVTGVTVLSTAVKYDITAAETAAGVTPTDYSIPSHDATGGVVLVNRYGINTTPGTTDMTSAFESAWALMKQIGGVMKAAPGIYYLTDIWDIVINDGVATAYPINYKFDFTGVEFRASTAVTGPQIRFTGSYNEFCTTFEGAYFNHRGNSTIAGCIEVLGTHCLLIHKCTVEMHSVGASYYFISFDTRSPGASEDDYNAFWCAVEHCSTRKRSGGESGQIKYAIKLKGAVNAFTARKNTLSNCDYGIYALAADTTATLPNAVTIDDNAFETIGTAAIHIQMTPAELGPTGWRIVHNRCESATTFFSLATGGAGAATHSQPPLLFGNFVDASTTNWILNPTDYPVSSMETHYPGFGPTVTNDFWQNGSLKFRFATGADMYLLDANNSNDYNRAKIFLGSYCVFLNNGDGKFYLKSGQPANATDGTVVGTQT